MFNVLFHATPNHFGPRNFLLGTYLPTNTGREIFHYQTVFCSGWRPIPIYVQLIIYLINWQKIISKEKLNFSLIHIYLMKKLKVLRFTWNLLFITNNLQNMCGMSLEWSANFFLCIKWNYCRTWIHRDYYV